MRKGLYPNVTVEQKREAMGIDWMNRGELAQAVPPAYAKFIGEAAIKYIREYPHPPVMVGRDPEQVPLGRESRDPKHETRSGNGQ